MNGQNLSEAEETAARHDFQGAKLILFLGSKIAVIRRDDLPGLPFPNCIDLPGGMREGAETPEACVLRELREELGLMVARGALCWSRFYLAPSRAWFFAAHLPETRMSEIVFGDEGQSWWRMDPWDYVASDQAVPHFRDRVRTYLSERTT